MVGWPFIIPAASVVAILGMLTWYRSGRDLEIARGRAAITTLLLAPVLTLGTIELRWGFDPAEGGPAGGITIIGALHETFWIWVTSTLVIFALHGAASRMLDRPDEDTDGYSK
ncbi:hypothetical protein K3172_10855 [Qipengyuania sp. 6B39]|uniref:hypothetical protein n=1 Tax=Qipengyuania proteolytica TaxID=2867239 RepID=UPI001C8AB08E|nr:hypothetical protein [Qipengyuania proteolytica]MBX7496353.1 hypothetical protein [Qipengyuania proteolytica]